MSSPAIQTDRQQQSFAEFMSDCTNGDPKMQSLIGAFPRFYMLHTITGIAGGILFIGSLVSTAGCLFNPALFMAPALICTAGCITCGLVSILAITTLFGKFS
ncbi:MAG: hypothetical protein K0S07_1328 [Chlamydiales bacterium]|jgi:hypothetical protein|nr:hypothetical protein [Chlamydiales bacterium]